jgi:TolB-like protein/Tfp pilus assembly protein PilF
LGVILYQILSARFPFPGETAQAVLYAIMNEAPKPLNPTDALAKELEKVILKALSKDVQTRYSSAEELLRDLGELKAGAVLKAMELPRQALPNTIAVLDFQNITKDQEYEWLSGGIAETVTVDLKRIASLQVIGREKISQAAGGSSSEPMLEQDAVVLGKRLGIRFIVWGVFQRMGDSVRITAHLTEMAAGDLLGSAKVDGSLQDIFKLQDEIIIQLADFLDLDVSDTEKAKIESPETFELEAYEYYARGRQLQIKMGLEGMATAQNYYEKALRIDPEYALAYSGLGGLYTLKYIASSRREDLELGIGYLQKAIQHDPELSDPYLWLTYGFTRKQQFDDAIRSGRRAVELEIDNPLAHYFLGVAYQVQAAMEYKKDGYPKALDHYRINMRLVPRYEPALMNSAWIYLLHGRYEPAQSFLRQAIELEESGKGEMVKFVGSLTLMGNLFQRQNEMTKAKEWYQRSLEVLKRSDHVYTPAFLAMTYSGLGRIEFSQWNYDLALANYRKAQGAIEKGRSGIGMGYVRIQVQIGMAKAFHGLGLTQEAKRQYSDANTLLAEKQEYDFSWIWEGCDAQAFYEFACYHAFLNQPQAALEHLTRAVEYGWADWTAIDNETCFETLRTEPEFQHAIQDWKKLPDILENISS